MNKLEYIGIERVSAVLMNRQEYNDLRGWEVPADEDPTDEGFLVERLDGGSANHADFEGYISWSPKEIFEATHQAQVSTFSSSEDDLATEEMVQERGLNAPRVPVGDLHDSVVNVDILRHVTKSGKVLRFAVLDHENGFSVAGRPSAAVSVENDNNDVGVKVAIQNSMHDLWPLVGFKLTQDLYEEQEELSKLPSKLTFGDAVSLMKKGKRVARDGWNGKGMFVYLVPADTYAAKTEAARGFFGETVPYNAYMAIKNVDGTVSTWVPSVNDTLAEDWVVVDD